MATSSEQESQLNLKETFGFGMDLQRKIESSDEPSGSQCIQKQITSSIEYFRKSTEMVNTLALFSTNEELDEVVTTNLRYLLLPAMLGNLSLQQMTDDRSTNVKMAKIYFLDFLKRCQDYGVTKQDVLSNTVSRNSHSPQTTTSGSLQQQATAREEKIRRYKEQKQQESRLKELEAYIEGKTSPSSEEDIQREYYMLSLKLWINKSIEQLALIEDELQILEHMEKIKTGKVSGVSPPDKQRKPMKPLLITRDMLQSKVFGAGYPSVPTITQEEYLEKEIREGKVVLEYNKDNPSSSQPNASKDKREEDKSDDDDDDDPEKLQKARGWDEWKDEHRRGEGNRENMG